MTATSTRLVLSAGAAIAAIALGLADSAEAAKRTYVSERGSDSAAGTRHAPLRSVSEALARARGGERVMVAAGDYPRIRDIRNHRRTVRVIGYDPRRRGRLPRIQGAGLHGASRLSFRRVRFTGLVELTNHPTLGHRAPPRHISISQSELVGAVPYASDCLLIRPGARNVTLDRSHVHHCRMGVVGSGDGVQDPNRRKRTRSVRITDNVIEHMAADGIVLAHWQDSRIAGNVIRYVSDVYDRGYHNDAIQVMGDGIRLEIVGNHLAHSDGQLLFIQDAVRRQSVRDSLVAGNLIHDSGAYAVQLIGTRRLRFLNNTVWFSRYGGVVVHAGTTRTHDTGAVLANNILEDLAVGNGVQLGLVDHNFLRPTWSNRRLRGPNDIVSSEPPGFLDGPGGDFRLFPGAPAASGANPGLAPSADLLGSPWADVPSMGAIQARG